MVFLQMECLGVDYPQGWSVVSTGGTIDGGRTMYNVHMECLGVDYPRGGEGGGVSTGGTIHVDGSRHMKCLGE